MEQTQKYYGILMSRILLKKNVSLHFPCYFISGKISKINENQYFEDELGNHYCLTDNILSLIEDCSLSVAFVISEQQLQEKYPSLTLSEASKRYFNRIQEQIHIGFYMEGKAKIYLKSYGIQELFQNERSTDSRQESSWKEEPLDGEDTVFLSKQYLENLLQIEDLQQLRTSLTEVLQSGEEVSQLFYQGVTSEEIYHIPVLTTAKLSGKSFLAFLQQINRRIKASTSILEVSKLLCSLEEALELVFSSLVSIDVDRKEEDVLLEYLLTLQDTLECVLALNDVHRIQEEMERFFEKENSHLQNFARIYDELVQDARIGNNSSSDNPTSTIIDARAMKKYLDQVIIGQEEAKKIVISALITNQLSEKPDERTACLLVGPTGSGKTLICETISKYLDIPIEIVDTTQLTVQGYVGRKLEDYLVRLLTKTKGNLELAQKSIVVFDELDKKGSEKDSDISGKGVLNMLLPFIQGTTYEVKYNGTTVLFDTSHLTIFATGAFTRVVAEKKKDNLTSRSHRIGFTSSFSQQEEPTYLSLEAEDFIHYGNMPDEIMGRFATIVSLEEPTPTSLKQILLYSSCSALLAEQRKMEKLGVTLCWTESYLDRVVEKAFQLKTGARALKSIIETSTLNARWEILMNPGKYGRLVLDADTVEDNCKFELTDKKGTSSLKNALLEDTGTVESAKVKRLEWKA